MFEAIKKVNRTDREGKEAMHQRLQELKRKPDRPLTFLLDEEEMERMKRRHTQSPMEKQCRRVSSGSSPLEVPIPWQESQ